MYNKDYETENKQNSIIRHKEDDTLYVLQQILNQYNHANYPILDLGSDDGHYHKYFEHIQFVGLDKNKTKNNKTEDLLLEQNIEEFPYTNNIPNDYLPFDFIICLDVLNHLIRPDKVLDYLYQDDHILNKNGYIFISVPNINTLDDKLNNINKSIYNPELKNYTDNRWNATHLRFFDINSLVYMSQNIGYKIVSITGSNFYTSNLFKQLGDNLNSIGIDGLTYGNLLRNTEFSLYAPNICILLQK